MYRMTILSVISAFLLVPGAGCAGSGEGPAQDEAAQVGSEPHGHSHEQSDELFWHREDIQAGDCQIKLGQHGTLAHAGHDFEPAVWIERDGAPVENAQVFVSVYDSKFEKVFTQEAAMVYEPPTDEEPAHYAHAKLLVPAKVKTAGLRYRIVFSDGVEHAYDVQFPVESH